MSIPLFRYCDTEAEHKRAGVRLSEQIRIPLNREHEEEFLVGFVGTRYTFFGRNHIFCPNFTTFVGDNLSDSMRVFHHFEQATGIPRPVVTIGSYDGVHLGHRQILADVRQLAQKREGESVVVTFHPHPRVVLGQGEGLRLLNTLPEKLELLESVGIDNVVVVDFTEEFSALSSQEFVRKYLVECLGVDTLMVGYNHHLGHNKQAGPRQLVELSRQFGFRLEEVSQQSVGGEHVSSTVIRALVERGEMARAAMLLGAPYLIQSTVNEQGQLDVPMEPKLLPPAGRYPVQAVVLDAPMASAPFPILLEITPQRVLHLPESLELIKNSVIKLEFA